MTILTLAPIYQDILWSLYSSVGHCMRAATISAHVKISEAALDGVLIGMQDAGLIEPVSSTETGASTIWKPTGKLILELQKLNDRNYEFQLVAMPRPAQRARPFA
ncbi:hypothetical protein GCM10027578_21940 [Spirosoma luteolum]